MGNHSGRGFYWVFAALLQKMGNPGNMGFVWPVLTGILPGPRLHRADVVQYMRPEIIGCACSLVAAYLFKEFRPRAGSAPIVRFVLGAFAMIGALVFLGCPWRPCSVCRRRRQRHPWHSGLIGGIWVGTLFLKGGYNLGRSEKTYASVGWCFRSSWFFSWSWDSSILPGGQAAKRGPFLQPQGSGSMHAPLAFSLLVGLAVGFLAQRSRFCTMALFVTWFSSVSPSFTDCSACWSSLCNKPYLGQFRICHTKSVWHFRNEIATLVNEEKQPGTYEVVFSPESSITKPASGIYFYQLNAGDLFRRRKWFYLNKKINKASCYGRLLFL